MKKHLVALIILVGVSSVMASIAYRQGLWVPNYPNEHDYPVRGIDVSHHQGDIQWGKVDRKAVSFVYIKATEGGNYRDSSFQANWAGTAAAGIRHGGYHYFTLKTSGKEQAKNFLAMVPKEPGALPPAIDLEFGGNSSARPPVADFQRELRDFIDAIKAAYGTEPVLYTESSFFTSYLKGFDHPRLWIRSVYFSPKGRYDWSFWQFSERLTTPGIAGKVDQNVFAGTNSQFTDFR